MLSLSYSLAENVRDRLTVAGAIANGPSSFTNCTHLPDELTLTLFVNTRIGGSQLSQIRFFPDDYITRDSVANTCSFHIAGTTPMFNPLLVPGMNVRLGNSADEGYRFLEICDTSL